MVGPWGWAARMKREDLLISTAVLMGYDFEVYHLHQRIFGRHPHYYTLPRQWEVAESWLRLHHIEFDGTE